jgi:hypothetical protein
MKKVKFYNRESSPKIKNTISVGKAPKKLEDKSDGILIWGEDNSFPQRLVETIYESHTASACFDIYNDFLKGDGFSDEALNTFKVNKDETLLKFHESICQDLTFFDGFAIKVGYTVEGKIASLRHIPFESCRLGLPDDTGVVSKIYYNPFYGVKSEYKKIDTICYHTFNPNPDVVQEQIAQAGGIANYNGQILWYAKHKPSRRFYPEPFYSGGIKWFKVDYSIGEFHERNINNNFLLSVLIKIVGDPDAAVETDDAGNVLLTASQEFDQMMQNQFSGSASGGMAMVLWSMVKEQFPEIQEFPTNANDALFETLQQLTIDNITIATKVPPIIAGIQVAGKLGNTQEIMNACELMQSRVNHKQLVLEQTYTKLLQGMGMNVQVDIKPVRATNFIPDKLLDYMDKAEIRDYMKTVLGIKLNDNTNGL